MPELPEVETLRRDLARRIVGAELGELWTSGKPLRLGRALDVAGIAAMTVGQRVLELRRQAKYLLLYTTAGGALVVHLGMTGHLLVCPADAPRGDFRREAPPPVRLIQCVADFDFVYVVDRETPQHRTSHGVSPAPFPQDPESKAVVRPVAQIVVQVGCGLLLGAHAPEMRHHGGIAVHAPHFDKVVGGEPLGLEPVGGEAVGKLGAHRSRRLKNSIWRSCRSAAARLVKVPRLRRFPVFGFLRSE